MGVQIVYGNDGSIVRVSCDKCGNGFTPHANNTDDLREELHKNTYFISNGKTFCAACWQRMPSVVEAWDEYPTNRIAQEAYYVGRTKPFTDSQVLAAAKAGREEDAKSHCTAGEMRPWDKTKTSSRNHWLRLANVMLRAASDDLK